jgi:hypothetical protein
MRGEELSSQTGLILGEKDKRRVRFWRMARALVKSDPRRYRVRYAMWRTIIVEEYKNWEWKEIDSSDIYLPIMEKPSERMRWIWPGEVKRDANA